MKTKGLTWLSIIVILVLALTGCARQAEVEETVEPTTVEQPTIVEPTATREPTATQPPSAEPTATQVRRTNTPTTTAQEDDDDERMIALISEKIENCHVLNFVLGRTKTAEQWSVTIDRMIGYGAKINAEEKELIINWLVSRNQ